MHVAVITETKTAVTVNLHYRAVGSVMTVHREFQLGQKPYQIYDIYGATSFNLALGGH